MPVFEQYKPKTDDPETIRYLLQTELGISRVTAGLLVNRGILNGRVAREFMNPSLNQLHDPNLLTGVDQAAIRIRQAIAAKEKIVIYGDYDVDGITSTCTLYLYLKSVEAIVDVYIPNRHEEGYGVNAEAVAKIASEGCRLMITVDCGITADREVSLARELGMDVIVTDHHTPGQLIPDDCIVINPKLPGQIYPFSELAGVGVVAKLIQALGGISAVKEYIDLISIGTIADVVPLVDENRVFAAKGIEMIRNCPRPGISALIGELGTDKKSVDSIRISYSLAPCLNAPGRLATYHKGFELLAAESVEKAQPIASHLVEQNNLRKEIEGKIMSTVHEYIREECELSRERIIIAAGEGWHPGVIGIVASRVTEFYNRPTVVLSIDGENASGSGRSIEGFNLYEALNECRDLFTRFGGHERAAGLSMPASAVEEFRRRMNALANRRITDDMLVSRVVYDGVLAPEDINPNLHSEIDSLAPFGTGNPVPNFLISGASIESSRLVGRDAKHLKLAVTVGQRSWDAIGFGMAHSENELFQGCRVDLLTSLQINEWMGVRKTQFNIKGLNRVLKTAVDIKGLLNSFYFKYFDVFLSGFMYNSNCNLNNILQTPIKWDTIDLESVYDVIEASPVGCLVVLHTMEMAELLLQDMLERGILGSISVRYHRPDPNEGIGANTVVLAPDINKIPLSHYHTLIVFGGELSLFCRHISSMLPDDGDVTRYEREFTRLRCLMAKEGSHFKGNKPGTESLTVDRDQMAAVYRWLRSLVPGQDYWPNTESLLSSYNNVSRSCLNGFQMLLTIEVFKELGFLQVENEGKSLRIRCVINPASRSLEESSLYMFHKSWISTI
jgi:single-stranded-DNA-specific exonuclease